MILIGCVLPCLHRSISTGAIFSQPPCGTCGLTEAGNSCLGGKGGKGWWSWNCVSGARCAWGWITHDFQYSWRILYNKLLRISFWECWHEVSPPIKVHHTLRTGATFLQASFLHLTWATGPNPQVMVRLDHQHVVVFWFYDICMIIAWLCIIIM